MRQVKNIFAVGMIAILMVACGKNSGNSDIIGTPVAGVYGGEKVNATDSLNKSVVALYHMKEHYLCTGSILSNDLILTAAHCVSGDMTQMVVIFAAKAIEDGELVKGVPVRHVLKGLHHPNFEPDHIKAVMMDDIGLIRFAGGLPAGYKPATVLVNYKAHIHNGSVVEMAGYGISSYLFKSGAGQLRKVTLTVADANYSAAETSIDQGVRKGICSGDSGGPAYLAADGKYLLWGVTSRGAGLFSVAPCIFGATYTRVDYYWSWLQTAAKEMGSSLPAFPKN